LNVGTSLHADGFFHGRSIVRCVPSATDESLEISPDWRYWYPGAATRSETVSIQQI
jgi:hypothetical protein